MELQAFLDSRGLTDADFAARVGRDRTTVSRWRRRETMPDAEAMRRVAEATDGEVTPNDFLGIAPPPDEDAS